MCVEWKESTARENQGDSRTEERQGIALEEGSIKMKSLKERK